MEPIKKFKHTAQDILEFARLNPGVVAKRILESGADDVAIFNQIEKIREHMFTMMDYDALGHFDRILKEKGWGQ